MKIVSEWATPEIWIFRMDHYNTQVAVERPANVDAVKYVRASTALMLSASVSDREEQIKDLAMLVKRLAQFAPTAIKRDAIDYLFRYKLTGSPLRGDSTSIKDSQHE
jgi:hypothetical protein